MSTKIIQIIVSGILSGIIVLWRMAFGFHATWGYFLMFWASTAIVSILIYPLFGKIADWTNKS